MKIVNVTPNSFSDGGTFFDHSAFESHYKDLLNLNIDYLDIGAESTAPMNDSIDESTELSRLESVVRSLLEKPFTSKVSLDTYKPNVANWFFNELKNSNKYECEQFVWNDVSGVLDDDVSLFLNKFKGANYIFCHNLAPKRSLSGDHMSFCTKLSGDDLISHMIDYFSVVKRLSYREHIIIDPCFGFSKSYEQNFELLNCWSKWSAPFSQFSKVLGISRKSFLRKYLENRLNCVHTSEPLLCAIHLAQIISVFSQNNSAKELIVRAHSAETVALAQNLTGDFSHLSDNF